MKPLTLSIVVANLIAFVAGATVPTATPATRVTARPLFPTTAKIVELIPTTKAAGLAVATPAAVVPQPLVDFPVRRASIEKRLYYQVGLDGTGAVPLGCLPYLCDGGLRFDGDPKTPGWQEDSAWVGGYYGPRKQVIPAKMKQLAEQLPPGLPYIVDVEDWPTDANSYTDAQVEDSIRRFRSIFGPLAASHVGDVGVYGIAPAANYYACTNYGQGMTALAKVQRGEAVTDLEAWYVGGVATWDRWGTGSIVLNPAADATKSWLALQAEDTRLTFGRTALGKVNEGGGLTDGTTASYPSCYDHQPGNDSIDYIQRSVEEARRINPGKPVYVFMWATYHPGGGSPQSNQPIALDEWRTEVAQAFAVADGVVLWDVTTANRPDHVRVALEELAKAQRAGKN